LHPQDNDPIMPRMNDERTVVTDLRSEAGNQPTSTLATRGEAAPVTGTPPEILAGYRRIRALGAGGMGDVYLAEQVQLHRQVALKILKPGADAGFAKRFLREATTMAAVTHPNVVAIHDAGEADGFLYMALELVLGGDLNRLLKTRGRLDER
jgi:serine/threonine protein kinase